MEEEEKAQFSALVHLSPRRDVRSGQREERTLLGDSDLEILSELIRLHRQFWCPDSSFSPQLCIDI